MKMTKVEKSRLEEEILPWEPVATFQLLELLMSMSMLISLTMFSDCDINCLDCIFSDSGGIKLI